MARAPTVLLIEHPDADPCAVMLADAAPAAFEVARATGFAEATSRLRDAVPDCVVVGLELTAAEGVEVVETLAALSPSVALVVLTDSADDELGVTTILAGAVDYLSRAALDGRRLALAVRHAIVRKRLESALDEAESIARIGRWELDIATNAVSLSREIHRLFSFRLDEAPTYDDLVGRIHPDDREATLQALRTTTEELRSFRLEHRILLPDGTVRWFRARGRVTLDATGRPEHLLGTAQDITDQRSAEDALAHQALHDPLTGLPNRVLFLDRVSQALTRLTRLTSTVGAIYLDVDRLKTINDSLGTPVGDLLLCSLAARLAGLIRPDDTLARVGGDEFVVLCEGLTGEAEAVRFADRICEAMTEPLRWDGGELVVSVSAGVAVATSSATSPDAFLRDADAAMYHAKSSGRARSAVFSETMRTRAIGALDTELLLRRSIAEGDLRLHYQPIVSLVDGQVLGHEALVRWAHPTRGLLGPDQFITLAEDTGLIVPLGAWVLREACRQARRFQTRDPIWADLPMSVNLSGGQLGQPDLVELVSSALVDADLRPEHLQLEMTESVLMDDAASTITVLQALKSLGVSLGIDDFGTGYSSLAYLRRFPVDVLKIDRGFVGRLGKDLEDTAIVAAIVSLADTLGLSTIAEGVETTHQRDSLIGLGATLAQGFLFARPVAAAEAEAVLDRSARAPGLPA